VRLDPSIKPFFVGAARGIEKDVLPSQGFAYELLDLHPIYRRTPFQNWKTVRGAFGAWRRLSAIAADRRPDVVVGTGGYAMGIAAAWAKAHGVPFVQQVGDVVPGITARWAARWSEELYLGFPEAASHFSTKGKIVATGNPIEPPPTPLPKRHAARIRWGFPQSKGRVVLVFGGSQGARAINEVVAAWIKLGLPEGAFVIWATGKGQYEPYRDLESPSVRVVPYLSPIADAYAAADVAITRAGAITCAELTAWGIPAVMIPLPTAAADHQTTNAKALEAAGCAVCRPQSELTVASLVVDVENILGVEARYEGMRAAARARAKPLAASEIAKRVLMVGERHSR
jgi:UDP-N-acetylglucosamine--N-acetylmuramyl-(pentapeptide) pyrophosphoryl-undecaprenol N-acetylglucosamine transferase